MGYEGSQDYDLALRIVRASAPERIRHIPAILYHWRRSPDIDSFPSRHLDKCIAAARRAKNDDFKDCKEQAQTVENPFIPSYDRIVRSLPAPPPLVTLVVPTKNKYEVLGPCIAGLLHRTDYCEKEIIIIDHQSDDPATLKLLERLGSERGVRIIKYEGPFNYSEMNNRAVQQARGDIIAFINNDVDVIDPGWLSEMASLAVVRENGAIGAKLLYSNDSVQHAGMVLGIGGIAGHMFKNWPITNLGYCGRLAMTSNVSAVQALVWCCVNRCSKMSVDSMPRTFRSPSMMSTCAFGSRRLAIETYGRRSHCSITMSHTREGPISVRKTWSVHEARRTICIQQRPLLQSQFVAERRELQPRIPTSTRKALAPPGIPHRPVR